MGYHTELEGRFNLDKELEPYHSAYLCAFSESRRMKRKAKIAAKLSDFRREAVNLPIGEEGEFYVGDGQDESVVDSNHPPKTQPGLWCDWVPTPDNKGIEWNQSEKFYNYVEWLQYLITNFLSPWGYLLNGEVKWRGEEWGDAGKIVVKDNKITTKRMKFEEYE